jgi:hypothetical protein
MDYSTAVGSGIFYWIVSIVASTLRIPFYIYNIVVAFLIFFILASAVGNSGSFGGKLVVDTAFLIAVSLISPIGFITMLILSYLFTKITTRVFKRKLTWYEDQEIIIRGSIVLDVSLPVVIILGYVLNGNLVYGIFFSVITFIVLVVLSVISLVLYEAGNLLERKFASS